MISLFCVGFLGTALYYIAPLFPYPAQILVEFDGGAATPLLLRDPDQPLRPEEANELPASPTATRIFRLAEDLDGLANHTVILSSDFSDISVFTQVGQLM